jgi:hexosaminidase
MPTRVFPAGLFLSATLFAQATLAIEPARLVPLPAQVTWKSGEFHLGPVIAADQACKATALQLAEMLHPATGIDFQIVDLEETSGTKSSITMKEDHSLDAYSKEAYRLSVTADGATITGASPAGVFYGAQTLRQLLPPQVFARSRQSNVEWSAPCVEIVDRPRFNWRGFMLDDSRHFLGAEYVKRLIDLMAMHKLNLLHWHLSDDDGFRIEIKSYPKLTEIGAWRGTQCKLPNTRPGERHARYGGFYTQQQIREIVAYAAARHIDIMPEIDVPGHSGAAAVAYPEILCQGTKSGNVWCAGREENYRMLDAMVGELAELFPFAYIHVGGDEVDHKAWANCPRCKALMQQQKLPSLASIQGYFIHRYEEIVRKHGRKMIGWNEILNPKLSKDSAIVAWQSVEPGYRAAAGGWNVVFAAGPHCYFDMKEAARDTWGHNWAGIIPVSKVYAFDPLSRPGLTDEQKTRVLGVQACLWTEFITSDERGDYKIWPRLCALAEMGWTPQPRRNFQEFMDRLGPVHLQRLGLLGVAYRVPDPEFIAGEPDTVRIQPPFTAAEIHYTTDGSLPNASSPRFNGEPIRIQNSQPVAAQVFLPGERTSHVVMEPIKKPKRDSKK